jgi:hypothetical protein
MLHAVAMIMARVTGLEPATSGVTGRRSNQLSYTRNSKGARVGWGGMGVKGDWWRYPRFTHIMWL